MKSGKAVRVCGIPVELLRAGDIALRSCGGRAQFSIKTGIPVRSLPIGKRESLS